MATDRPTGEHQDHPDKVRDLAPSVRKIMKHIALFTLSAEITPKALIKVNRWVFRSRYSRPIKRIRKAAVARRTPRKVRNSWDNENNRGRIPPAPRAREPAEHHHPYASFSEL